MTLLLYHRTEETGTLTRYQATVHMVALSTNL